MSELRPRVICDLCRKGDGDNLCYAGGVDKCLKDGKYTKFELRRVQPDEPLTDHISDVTKMVPLGRSEE